MLAVAADDEHPVADNEEGPPCPADERRKLVSAAKVRVGKAMRFIGQQAIQMHGGMGMTNEMSISHYFKRLTAIEVTLGNTDFHRSRFIRQPDFAAV